MEPSYLCNDSEHGKMIQNFIFWGGCLVTIADGLIEEAEIKALSSIVNPEVFEANYPLIPSQNEESLKQMLAEMSGDMNNLLSIMQKLNIIRDMCIISSSDGEIDSTEVDVLYGLAHLLSIRESFVDKVLEELTLEE